MILTTKQQANNFAIYALETERWFSNLNNEALVGELMQSIRLVFGRETFASEELEHIAEAAIKCYDEVA
jgi:hypothetical protein